MSVQDFREENAIGKAYDGRLVRRLLRYAKPYWAAILVSVLLIGFVTSADLAPPYLSAIAIDSYIGGLSQPMAAFSPKAAPAGAVLFGGRAYVRIPSLHGGWRGPLSEIEKAPGGREYLVQGIRQGKALTWRGDVPTLQGRRLRATPLTAAALSRFRGQDVHGLLVLGLVYSLVVLVAFAANYLQTYALQWAGQMIVSDIRRQLFSHIEAMHLQYFDRNPIGRLVTRVTNDTEALNEVYTSVIVNIFKDLFLLLGAMAIMWEMNRFLALISYAIIPLLIVTTAVYTRFARDAYRTVRIYLARINAFLSENFAGMRVVQAMRQELGQQRRFDQDNTGYLRAGIRELTIFAVFRPTMNFFYNLTAAALIWWGGGTVLEHIVAFGVLYAFIGYAQQFYQPINDMADKYQIMQAAMAASERIFQVLDTPQEVLDPEVPRELQGRLRGEIRFEHVWFAYEGEDWVLRDVDFTVQPGQSVAFVGATGAGKSSIVNLIGRYYDVQRGRVLVDGHDVRDLPQQELRRAVGMVLQDVFLFAGNVRDNIRLGDDIPADLVAKAAAHVHADTFIERLGEGYGAAVLERGATFSAGQRQLIAFARVLAHDPDVLVLDEATASIDTETEALIQSALERVSAGRTTLIVAHRLSTIRHCAQIFVLSHGRIVERGMHEELLARRGLYWDLYRLQYRGGEDADARLSGGAAGD